MVGSDGVSISGAADPLLVWSVSFARGGYVPVIVAHDGTVWLMGVPPEDRYEGAAAMAHAVVRGKRKLVEAGARRGGDQGWREVS